MSSHGYSRDCPMCYSTDTLMIVSNNTPYDNVSGECIECGFSYWTQTGRMELDEVNEMRVDRDLPELTELKPYVEWE